MKIFVDIDETICVTAGDKGEARDYSKAKPILSNINKINEYYDSGNEITYWTARGSGTGIDWERVTRVQLKQWGAKHHNLIMKKPIYDLYIDDKSINVKSWENNFDIIKEFYNEK